ncbi:hypothetical protein TNCV_4463201 [Trichonephila clavipes]|nr:hypothetical protein TNCV_4463201 [Trichonephila clavipes]
MLKLLARAQSQIGELMAYLVAAIRLRCWRPWEGGLNAIVVVIWIVRSPLFCEREFRCYRSRASSKHLSSHLPVGSLDSSGVKQGCAGSEIARVGVESTKKPTPDVVVVFET